MQVAVHKLRIVLHEMEKSFGLTKLTPVERDVLYVIESLSEKADPIASQEILSHDLTLGVSRPTIYRALNRLLEEQLIRKSPVAERGFFTRLRNLPES